MSTEESTAQSSVERPRRIDRVTLPVLDGVTFSTRGDGGYEPDEVDALIQDVKGALDAADDERTALRADVAHLRDRLEDQGQSEITVDAVGLLSQAQVIADKCIADAETYARDLMMTARSQYREVLERAEQSAKEAADKVEQPGDAGPDNQPNSQPNNQPYVPAQPVPEVEYVRTYARVAQVQLRAVLDALAEQVEMLGRVPGSGESGTAPTAAPSQAPSQAPEPAPAADPVVEPTGWPGDGQHRSYGEVVWEHHSVG
jgi:cell division septum initiation protein DivIVA